MTAANKIVQDDIRTRALAFIDSGHEQQQVRNEVQKAENDAINRATKVGEFSSTIDFMDAHQELDQVHNAIREKYRDLMEEVAAIVREREKIVDDLRPAAEAAEKKINECNNQMASAPKTIAKSLGIPTTYLTGTGSMSMAKIKTLAKKDPNKAQEIVDLYNTKYVKMVNEAIQSLKTDERFTLTDEEREGLNNVNDAKMEYNKAVLAHRAFIGK